MSKHFGDPFQELYVVEEKKGAKKMKIEVEKDAYTDFFYGSCVPFSPHKELQILVTKFLWLTAEQYF